MTESTTRRVMAGTSANGLRFSDADGDLEFSLPAVERTDDVDLKAEGLDLDRLRDRLHVDPEGRPRTMFATSRRSLSTG